MLQHDYAGRLCALIGYHGLQKKGVRIWSSSNNRMQAPVLYGAREWLGNMCEDAG